MSPWTKFTKARQPCTDGWTTSVGIDQFDCVVLEVLLIASRQIHLSVTHSLTDVCLSLQM